MTEFSETANRLAAYVRSLEGPAVSLLMITKWVAENVGEAWVNSDTRDLVDELRKLDVLRWDSHEPDSDTASDLYRISDLDKTDPKRWRAVWRKDCKDSKEWAIFETEEGGMGEYEASSIGDLVTVTYGADPCPNGAAMAEWAKGSRPGDRRGYRNGAVVDVTGGRTQGSGGPTVKELTDEERAAIREYAETVAPIANMTTDEAERVLLSVIRPNLSVDNASAEIKVEGGKGGPVTLKTGETAYYSPDGVLRKIRGFASLEDAARRMRAAAESHGPDLAEPEADEAPPLKEFVERRRAAESAKAWHGTRKTMNEELEDVDPGPEIYDPNY